MAEGPWIDMEAVRDKALREEFVSGSCLYRYAFFFQCSRTFYWIRNSRQQYIMEPSQGGTQNHGNIRITRESASFTGVDDRVLSSLDCFVVPLEYLV